MADEGKVKFFNETKGFGYVERRKPAKKQRRDDDASANGAPREVRVRTTVDFTKLGMATLKKYKRHYRLKARTRLKPRSIRHRVRLSKRESLLHTWLIPVGQTRQSISTKSELAQAVAKHFAAQTVDEAETISAFIYTARAPQYSSREYLGR